jgi:predicted transcriptional regulator
MNSPWGKKPRKLDEIRRMLEMLGFPLTRSTAAVTLLRLTKAGKIRRFKDESGEYLYLQLTSTIGEQSLQQSSDSSEINKSS